MQRGGLSPYKNLMLNFTFVVQNLMRPLTVFQGWFNRRIRVTNHLQSKLTHIPDCLTFTDFVVGLYCSLLFIYCFMYLILCLFVSAMRLSLNGIWKVNGQPRLRHSKMSRRLSLGYHFRLRESRTVCDIAGHLQWRHYSSSTEWASW